MLGQGGFGKLLLAECKSRGRSHHEGLCAVKVLKKENVIRNKCIKFVEAERDILNLVHGHPFVITLYSCFQTKVIFQIFNSVS
jgi:3-phosphoinositide dependent protein kinase-1